MMNKPKMPLLLVWAVLLVLPALIVAGFYWLFGNLNYFGLQNFFRGVIATGPIAAYIFLIWFGYTRVYKDIEIRSILRNISEPPPILGKWSFKSRSIDDDENRNGICYITQQNGEISISGTFVDKGVNTGNWKSIMSAVKEDRCMLYYELNVLNRKTKKPYHYEGICLIAIDSYPVTKMKGYWRIIGNKAPMGYIQFKRAKD